MGTRNARIGLRLFWVYLLVYGGFVLTNAFYPDAMEATPFGGLNVALLSGVGLIVFALVLALVYGVLAKADEPGAEQAGGDA